VIAMTAAVWYVVGFRAVAARARAGAAIGARLVVALAVGGAIAGATTRPLATATLASCAVIAARAGSRGRWAIAGLAGVAVGATLAWLSNLHAMLIFLEQSDINAQLHTFDVQTRSPIWSARPRRRCGLPRSRGGAGAGGRRRRSATARST